MQKESKIHIELKFAAAHRLLGYEGNCGVLHGHTWKVEVEISGEPDKSGLIMDFRRIKRSIKKTFDHTIILNKADPLVRILEEAGQEVRVIDGNPTCENLAYLIAETLMKELKLSEIKVRVWESDNSYAEVKLSESGRS